MRKIIFLLALLNVFVFAFAGSLFKTGDSIVEYTISMRSRSDYSSELYKTQSASVTLKLVTVYDNQPTVIWERKLTDMLLRSYPFGNKKSIIRKLNLNTSDKNTYMVYTVVYNADGNLLRTDKAELIDEVSKRINIEI